MIGSQAQISVPLVAGELSPPASDKKTTVRSVLSTGLTVFNEFDDNALSFSQHKQSNMITYIEPHIGWSLLQSRASWTFDYRPGFALSHQLAMYDSRSQVLDTSLQLTFTHHLSLQLHEGFLDTRNPFDFAPQSASLLGSSVVDHPNAPVAAVARARSERSEADVYYALSRHTIVALGGAFFRVAYEVPEDDRMVARTQSASGHAIYSIRLSRRHWVGAEYAIQDLNSDQPQTHASVQRVFYTDTAQIKPNMSVTFFAGPEHLMIRNIVSEQTLRMSDTSWRWAGGISYGWTGARTVLTAGLSRRISDGGGLQGVVRASSVTADLRRQVARRWQAGIQISYNANTELAGASVPLDYISVATDISRALAPHLSLNLRYWRTYDLARKEISTPYFADHNRISASVIYNFKTPLMR